MPTPTERARVACPRCRGAMTDEAFGRARLKRCTACGGFWFDQTELQTLLERRDSDHRIYRFPEIGVKTDRRCPQCDDTVLWTQQLGPVPIDWCWRCRGLFVHRQHLESLQRDPPRQRLDTRSAARLLDMLLDIAVTALG